METKPNRYITVAYKLYSLEDDGEKELLEEATQEHPFQFISGLATTLEHFEDKITELIKGDKFDFIIAADDAYGDYYEDHIINLPKNIFEVNGRFDSEMIKEGNTVPLMNADGQRLNGTVVEVKPDVVVMDMNHPLAGVALNFVGEVTENREATPEEIQGMVNMMTSDGCDCGSCNGGCDEDHDHNGCGGGHCH